MKKPKFARRFRPNKSVRRKKKKRRSVHEKYLEAMQGVEDAKIPKGQQGEEPVTENKTKPLNRW